jgi:YVTN family beta-propeller protein
MSAGRLALVVTVDHYDHPGLRELGAPAADAEALADVLGDPDLGGFELEFLHNQSSWTTYERVEGLLADRRPSDLVLLHFSCHGLKDVGGELYLAASNTVPDRLASTAVDSAWIARMMQRSRAQRVVLLLDCCYGGAFERGVLARAGDSIDVGDQFRPGNLGEGRGRAVITASTAMEYAFEGTQLSDGTPPGPSMFTSALVEGIRTGDADRDQDGYVALDELYDYVYERVQEHTPQQTPCKWEFGLRGELYVARNPHRRVAPARLPQELLDLLDHPTPAARLAAVEEVTRLTAGTNLARAAAARVALQQLADDDSRRVAAAAGAALRDTAVRLAAPVVDFGVVPAGTPRLTADVAVQGPPLALASSVATAGAGLRARVEAGVLRISWVPQPGRLEGTVTLSGPAGEARLRVTGELAEDAAAGGALQDLLTPRGADTGRPWWNRRRPAEASPPARPDVSGPAPRPVPAGRDGSGGLRDVFALGRRRGVWLLAVVLLMSTVIGLGARTAMQNRVQGGHIPGATPSPGTTTTTPGTSAPPATGPPASIDKPTLLKAIPVGVEPEGVAVSPDSRTLYVTTMGSRTLSLIDTANPDKRFDVHLKNTPWFVALSRDGRRAYVSMFEDDKPGTGSGIAVIDTAARKLLKTVPTAPKPYALAVAPDGRLWVPIHNAARVEIFDGSTVKPVGQVTVPESPHSVAFSSDGSRAYTPDHESNKVSVIDARKDVLERNLAVGTSPHTIAVSPDGRTVMVANYDDATVNKIDAATLSVSRPIPVGTRPQSITFARDGAHAYVVNEEDDSVTTLNTAGGRPTSTLTVGKSPRVVTTSPDGRLAYVTNGGDNTVDVLKIAG